MKKLLLLITSLIFCLNVFGCKDTTNTKNLDRKFVLVSFTILEDILNNIVGEELIVESITRPGIEVHGYKTNPSDMIRGSKADLFIKNGFGYELWADKFVSNLKVKTITIADNLDPIFISEDSYKGKPNPHAWISPKRGIIYVDVILASLIDLQPNSQETFEINAKAYKEKLFSIDKDFSLFLNTLDNSKRYLVSCEGAFSYLTEDYGLKEAYLWPINAESQITPKRMARVINLVKEKNIPSVFCESTVSSESQKLVSKESGAKFGGIFYVDSLSNKEGPAGTYLDLLNHNLNLIKKGFNPITKN